MSIDGKPNWPFDQPRNCTAIAMRQVLQGIEHILLVSHDADDQGWQFIGNTREQFHLVEIDPDDMPDA